MYSNGGSQCLRPALGLTVVSLSSLAAVIKAPFQDSTQRDLYQRKHSLSEFSLKTLHWDVKWHVYVGETGKM